MPQFAFSATDRMGNTIEGNVSALDMGLAADQVRQMGYTPIRVQIASPPSLDTTVAMNPQNGSLTEPTAAMVASSLNGGNVALEPTMAMPQVTQQMGRTLVPLTGEDEDYESQQGRLEPWQRGGSLPQPPAPTATLNMAGTRIIPNAAAAPPSVYTPPTETGAAREGRAGVHIPYGAGNEEPRSFWQRFKETMIYPVYSGVVIKDLAPFYRQFATLIDAGLPLYQALIALEGNTNNSKLKEVARAAQLQVQAGGKFSDVMRAYRWIFTPMQIELVRAAEKGGLLDQVLVQIADYIEHEIEIRRLISRETIYPKFTLFCALMILGGSGFSGGLPAIAGLVLGSMGKVTYTMSDYLMDTVGLGLKALIPVFLAVVVCRLFLFNIKGVREGYDRIKLAIPVLGNLVKQFALAKFARTFAALYRGGFTMSTSLEIAGDACGNAVIREAAHRSIRRAEQGGLVSDSLAAAGVFPPMALNMFRTGEASGNLDVMLDKMADFFESEAKTKSHQAAVAFGVLVFLMVALLVGRAVISQYMSYGSSVSNAGE